MNGVTHLPVTMDDANKCTTDSCDVATGVKHVPISVDDGNPCTIDVCDPVTGPSHPLAAFDDANVCTADSCNPFSGPVHTTMSFDDNNACTVDSCDPVTGVSHAALDPSDGNACTTDACDKLFGVSHTPIVCNDSDACTTDACSAATGCVFAAVNVDDGNICTTDTCDPLAGVQHSSSACDDGNACTVDSCNPQIGCQNISTIVFTETFANNAAGWTLGTNWGMGSTLLSSGHSLGGPDPSADHTTTADNRVAGVVIGGNLPTTIIGPTYLTSPAINLTGVTTPMTLEFYRWLNSDYLPYMTNYVDIFDGTSWINVFTTGASPGINDTSWVKIQYNIPASALNKANVRVRFGYSVNTSGALLVASWNVDDVRVMSGSVPNLCP
jgi:hypothetical protein